MKKCDYFQDLILTEYIDGELDKNILGVLEGHLLDCSDCRALLREVKDSAVNPLKLSVRQPVPGELWDAIKQGVEEKNNAASPWVDFIDNIKGLFVFPRLVPVFASLFLMFLAGSVTLNNIQIQQTRDRDQGEYLISLLSPAGPSLASESSDTGTPIEHYFL